MPNKLDDLRDHLFGTLAALRDKDAPMDLDRARTVAEVAKVLVDSAKVEVDFLKVTGATQGTGFLPDGDRPPKRERPALAGRSEAAAGAIPAGERCTLCGVRLETPYWIERGLCGSCSDRPEGRAKVNGRQSKELS